MSKTHPRSEPVQRAGDNSAYNEDGHGKLSELEKMCKAYDTSGDGMFSINEVKNIVKDMKRAEAESKTWKRMAGILAFAVIVALCLVFGITIAANEASKESHVSKSGVMESLDGKPLAVAEALTEAPLSSLLPDSSFTEMKSLKLGGPNNPELFLSMNVLATARYANKASRCGTVVVIFTHLGEITLDGEDVYFEEKIVGAFSAAGFSTSVLDKSNFGGKRRLADASMIQGLFNAVAEIKLARCAERADNIEGYKGLIDGPLPDLPTSKSWRMHMTTYKECDTSTPVKLLWCQRQHGAVPHPTDFPGKLFFSIEEIMTLGKKVSMFGTNQVSWDNHAGRTKHNLQDGTDSYTWEKKGDQLYNCRHDPNRQPVPALVFEAKATYYGSDFVVNGFQARKWRFKTVASGTDAPVLMEIWDRKTDNKLLRMRSVTDTASVEWKSLTEENPSLVAIDKPHNVVDVLSLEDLDHASEGTCAVEQGCDAPTVPDFSTCINYADTPSNNPADRAGKIAPMTLMEPDIDSQYFKSTEVLTPPPTDANTTIDWMPCTTPTDKVYHQTHASTQFGIALTQAKSTCYKLASCTGFSHNPTDATFFYSQENLKTCVDATGVDPPEDTGDATSRIGWTTYGNSIPRGGEEIDERVLWSREDIEKVFVPFGTVDMEISKYKSPKKYKGQLASMKFCNSRRLTGDNSTLAAEERRRLKGKLQFGFGGCIYISQPGPQVGGCVSVGVSLGFMDVFSIESCIGLNLCGFAELNIGASLGGWFVGASISASMKWLAEEGKTPSKNCCCGPNGKNYADWSYKYCWTAIGAETCQVSEPGKLW